MYTNFHPLRLARTAKSMSSTVVRSFHPPASFRAEILHTPAVPILYIYYSYTIYKNQDPFLYLYRKKTFLTCKKKHNQNMNQEYSCGGGQNLPLKPKKA